MKYRHTLIENLIRNLSGCIALFSLFSATAAPTAKNLSIRSGTSPSIIRNSWATMRVSLTNPDSKDATIELRLQDNLKGTYAENTLFTDIVTVPAKTEIYYQSPVLIQNSEEYHLVLFYKGKYIGETTTALIKLVSQNRELIPVLNDSSRADFGSFTQLPEFKNRYTPSFFYATTPLTEWIELKKAPFVVMVRPDFTRYSADKFEALIDYVQQGGSILFSDPQGLKDAANTPIAPLLPVKPLRSRKIVKLPEIKQLMPSFQEFSKPVEFLESVPNGDGITLFRVAEFPLLRLKRYGLGSVTFLAVPAQQDAYKSTAEWGKLLDLLFLSPRLYNNNETIKPLLDEMTGFTVPGLSTVRWIIILYLLLLTIPLGFGLYTRKVGISWIGGGVISLLFASTILYTALAGTNMHKKDFLSFIEVVSPFSNSITGIGYYGIMSNADKTVTIKADCPNVIFSAIPYSEDKLTFTAEQSGKQPPIEVKRINGIPEISELNLPVNSPRHLYAAFSLDNMEKSSLSTIPQITKSNGEIKFTTWKIPERFNPYAAWLQFPSGFLDLSIKNGSISQQKSHKVFDSDLVMHKIKTFITQGFKYQHPMLILVENSRKPSVFSLNDTIIHGKRVIAVPVSRVFQASKIVIHPEEVTLTPENIQTKLIMNGNTINSSILARSDTEYTFKFQLPTYLTDFKPERLKVELSYTNDSKNIILEPFILGKGEYVKVKVPPKRSSRKRKNKNRQKQKPKPEYTTVFQRKQLMPHKNDNGIYLLSGSECTDIIDPKLSSGVIGLKIRIKNKMTTSGIQKNNIYTINKFRITVEGTMPTREDKITY